MKARTMIIAMVAAAVLAAPGVSIAQGGPGGPGGPGGGQGGWDGHGGPGGFGAHGGFGIHRLERMLPRLAEYLDLSQEQQDQIQAILDEEMPAIQDLRDQIHTARQAFMDGHVPGEFDEAALRAFLAEQSPLKIDLAVAGARTMSRVLNVLTPEQREQLEKLRGLRGRRGPRHGCGQVKP